MSGKLEKYRLKNLPKGTNFILSSRLPNGRIHIDHMTDELAALLIGDGVSRYVEEIRQAKAKKVKT